MVLAAKLMQRFSRTCAVLFTAAVMAALVGAPARGQGVDPLAAVPGGASGSTAVCIQVGELNSGTFVGTFLQSSNDGWEERGYLKPGVARMQERQRSETVIELRDTSRNLDFQIDFERKRVRQARSSDPNSWQDQFHILNATDRESATDCVSLATRATSGPAAAGPQSRPNGKTIQFITVRIGTVIVVPPGTKLTATSGPACPGQPGFFLCPNKFTCAPVGGVCCPGAGACGAGTFCDRFIPNSCIGPGDPAFCAGTGDPTTGISLHCAPGSTCLPGNVCNP